MASKINRLTHRGVLAITRPGWHGDGARLYLRVQAGGAKSWVYVYQWRGKRKEMGLGPALTVDLAEARKKAKWCAERLDEGLDPATTRQLELERKAVTFGEMADQYVTEQEGGWKNAKHIAQWKMTLKVYAAPLRPLSVSEITPEDVFDCIKPIWKTHPETASRTLNRIARVFSAAKARGLRKGENPAAWADNLEHRLDRRDRLTRGHHEALALDQVATFLRRLRAMTAVSPRALEFTILTAARTGEVLGATWAEIDLEKAVWTIPARRMKMKRAHAVPLSSDALAVLNTARAGENVPDPDAFVFPGLKPGKGLSNMAMENVLRRMNVKPTTVHGFRSCFRDWAGTLTEYPRELAEEALAHQVGDDTERAYKRLQAVERRRRMMTDWADFCGKGEVIPFERRGATA